MAQRFLYNFGMSQEDERSEFEALSLHSASRVLSVCSAGEMPLSLLAMGAGKVEAIDIDDHQLHLAQLKRAAVLTLERPDVVGLLGYLPMSENEREKLYRKVDTVLPSASRAFWQKQMAEIRAGAVWAACLLGKGSNVKEAPSDA